MEMVMEMEMVMVMVMDGDSLSSTSNFHPPNGWNYISTSDLYERSDPPNDKDLSTKSR